MSPEQCLAYIERGKVKQWAWDWRKLSPLNLELMLRWNVPEELRQQVLDQVKYLKKKHNWKEVEE